IVIELQQALDAEQQREKVPFLSGGVELLVPRHQRAHLPNERPRDPDPVPLEELHDAIVGHSAHSRFRRKTCVAKLRSVYSPPEGDTRAPESREIETSSRVRGACVAVAFGGAAARWRGDWA